jgi:hypothetical protein
MRWVFVVVVVAAVIAGCGGQTRTVTVTTSQTTPAAATTTSPTTPTPTTSTTPRSSASGSADGGGVIRTCPARQHWTMSVSRCEPDWQEAEPWVVNAQQYGCPTGEVLAKTLSNGQPAPHGNDGCVSAASGECSPSDATCDPANVPGGTSATQNCASSYPNDTAIVSERAASKQPRRLRAARRDVSSNRTGRLHASAWCPVRRLPNRRAKRRDRDLLDQWSRLRVLTRPRRPSWRSSLPI